MLRPVVAATRVGVRFRSTYSRRTKKVIWQKEERTAVPGGQSAAWSTGEVKHPAKPDCPLGNKDDYPKEMANGGFQYFGFQYYPRYPGEEDPPYEPSPLHLVTRVRCLRGKPWWDREIMHSLGLGRKRSDVAIVKNNPENNARLWKVKHMVKVTPIRLPANMSLDADPRCCFLKETGEFSVTPQVQVEDSHLEQDPKFVSVKWTTNFVDKHTRKNWYYPWQMKLC